MADDDDFGEFADGGHRAFASFATLGIRRQKKKRKKPAGPTAAPQKPNDDEGGASGVPLGRSLRRH